MEHTSEGKMPREKESMKRKKLQLLGMQRAYLRYSGSQEEEMIRVNIPLDHSNLKSTHLAYLEAERRKAEALMHFRRRHLF